MGKILQKYGETAFPCRGNLRPEDNKMRRLQRYNRSLTYQEVVIIHSYVNLIALDLSPLSLYINISATNTDTAFPPILTLSPSTVISNVPPRLDA
jgi:hypothetical protein